MSADIWAASGPSSLALDRVDRKATGRPAGSAFYSPEERRERHRARALAYYHQVGKARRAQRRLGAGQ